MHEPIAIVGQSCILPGALSPEELWQAIAAGRNLISRIPADRHETFPDAAGYADRTGGYVRGFGEVFDPRGFHLPADQITGLDPLFHWSLHCARIAWQEAGGQRLADRRTGVILGNMSYPTTTMCEYARHVREDQPGTTDARNRFMSGLPALVIRDALALHGPAYALDAACASSLYALKNACDLLVQGQTDVMLAGAVNRADELFIHAGFAALGALSATGCSAPFSRQADGLLPAVGAAFVALKRLRDALTDGDTIHGIIHGIGVSNDGRSRGLLVPSSRGQVQAISKAWDEAGLDPTLVSLMECHATGTPLGDRTELLSMNEVFSEADDIPIGSFKSNTGHLVTVAGLAGMLKIIGAMKAGIRPPSLHADDPIEELAGSPFRVLHQAEPWDESPRLAGLSAFGFGGNNAHLVIGCPRSMDLVRSGTGQPSRQSAVAVVGLGAVVGDCADSRSFARTEQSDEGRMRGITPSVKLPLQSLRFPPADLKKTLPQQLVMLRAAMEAMEETSIPARRTGVFVGMGVDPEVCRYATRLHKGIDAVSAGIIAPRVIGSMPNIPANRLNSHFDLTGPGYSISAEEDSGTIGLDLAILALNQGELDACLVGAVDLNGQDKVHHHAGNHPLMALPEQEGDAAVALVLKREEDARRDGDIIYGLIESAAGPDACRASRPMGPFGHAHAASGLLRALAAITRRCFSPAQDSPQPHHLLPVRQHSPGWQIRTGATDLPMESPAEEGPQLEIPVHRPAPAGATSRAPSAPRRSSLQRAHAMATRAHQSFLATQTAAHGSFLEASASLLGHGTGRRSPAPRRTRKASPSLSASASASASASSATTESAGSPGIGGIDIPAPVTRPMVPGSNADTGLKPSSRRPFTLSREQLEVHASGRISDIYGPLFRQQDDYPRQVRMPEPPLLIAEEVTALEAEPGVMGKGIIRTRTHLTDATWYMFRDHIPAGIMIESGQADLMLISWMGIDFLNKGERVYRLLGCEITYSGGLPAMGDTLEWNIHINRHAKHGDVQIFFFDCDCYVNGERRLKVRNGHAGCFTFDELDDSTGVLFNPADHQFCEDPGLMDPEVVTRHRQFSTSRIHAFAEGRLVDCFGPGFEKALTHSRSPGIQTGKMCLLHQIPVFDPQGGPAGRGYLRAEWNLSPDDWFFPCHFKNDPCMPGTLMFEAGLQAMAFYLSAIGLTLDRDGWRFEPVMDQAYKLFCRGQATPENKLVTWELFVEEVVAGPEPTLWCDLLVKVDGLNAFHTERLGLRLVPDWPQRPRHLARPADDPAAARHGGAIFDEHGVRAHAFGRLEEAFGPDFAVLDSTRRGGRIPSPPFLFLTRIEEAGSLPGEQVTDREFTALYSIPADAWYFADHHNQGTMPFCVFLEAALQACGWLASYSGAVLAASEDLFFRNLDGVCHLYREPDQFSGDLRTRLRLTNISRTGSTVIQSFGLTCYLGEERIAEISTVFGFFTAAALARQVGLPAGTDRPQEPVLEPATTAADQRIHTSGCASAAGLQLPDRLRMVDEVIHRPEGGRAGLGELLGEYRISPDNWYFKAHFFQDPVQPGSLGLQAMLQLLQIHMIETGMDSGMARPRFESVIGTKPLVWKYRGQVLPANQLMQVHMDITDVHEEPGRVAVRGNGSLWVDGKRIYEASDMQMAIIDARDAH